MNQSGLGIQWIKMAALYLLVGVALGVHMGKSHDFTLSPVHAHANLLGWATMALMGLLHHYFAAQLVNRLARVQFWMHQLATPVLLVALALMLLGDKSIEPLVGAMSIVVGLSVLLFVINVWRNLRA